MIPPPGAHVGAWKISARGNEHTETFDMAGLTNSSVSTRLGRTVL